MKILITGGTGLAGSFIVRELLARGKAVRILSRQPSLPSILHPAELYQGDLADKASLQRAANGVQGIVHVASTLDADLDTDIEGTKELIALWKEGPFIYIGSVDVYGLPKWTPTTEDHPLDETYTPYARAKILCETMLREQAEKHHRSDYTILRPPVIWGPDPRCTKYTVDKYADKIRKDESITLPGTTEAERSQYGDAWVDTRDLAWVVAECLTKPLGGAANVLSGHLLWHEVFSETIRLLKSKSQIVHEGTEPAYFAQTWRYSDTTLRNHLGFQSRYDWKTTLAEAMT